jgi:hypothetical protein
LGIERKKEIGFEREIFGAEIVTFRLVHEMQKTDTGEGGKAGREDKGGKPCMYG